MKKEENQSNDVDDAMLENLIDKLEKEQYYYNRSDVRIVK